MCGIAGVRDVAPLPDAALASRLDAALAHRGPDAYGHTWLDGRRLLLVHRRLAIIDPTPAAGQPMQSPAGDAIVFNGEIYNYAALRAALHAKGVASATGSDTEVALHWLAQHGPLGLADFRGMFALAFWDARNQSLLLARDRFGIKPLYFSERGGRVVFASEVRALVRSGLVAGHPNAAGVLAFLQWGSVAAPLTWIDGVRALEPGEWRLWSSSGETRGGRFADRRCLFARRAGHTRAEGTLIAETRHALEDSVAAHLVADVPVGAFLSGGLDSAALTAIASRLNPGALHTYTVAVDDASLTEQHEARQTARALGTEHHELSVDAATVTASVHDFVDCIDSPTVDGLNSFFVSRAAAATGIKAVLSGIGADELFGGYPSFRRIARAQSVGAFGAPLVRGAALAAQLTGARSAARWRHLASCSDDLVEQYRAVRGFFMPHEIAGIAGARLQDARHAFDEVSALDEARLAPQGPEDVYGAVARMESVGYMSSQLLRDADVTSMAHGLELRVPFVDHMLIGAVWPHLGASPRLAQRKRLLADVMASELPLEVRTRRKRGFILPMDRWMRGALGAIVKDRLHSLEATEWIRRGAAGEVWDAWQQRRSHWTRPWGLAILGALCNDTP